MVMALSTTLTQCAPKTTKFGKITQCRFGVALILIHILGMKYPKNDCGDVNMHFKLNAHNIKTCILSKLPHRIKPTFARWQILIIIIHQFLYRHKLVTEFCRRVCAGRSTRWASPRISSSMWNAKSLSSVETKSACIIRLFCIDGTVCIWDVDFARQRRTSRWILSCRIPANNLRNQVVRLHRKY